MSYDTVKYILWGMLCFPILFLGVYFFSDLLSELRLINVYKKKKQDKVREEQQKAQSLIRQRQRFDEDYDNYLNRKYDHNR